MAGSNPLVTLFSLMSRLELNAQPHLTFALPEDIAVAWPSGVAIFLELLHGGRIGSI